jgi:hypothetical protein
VYELRLNCGLGIIRLQFFTPDEIRQLQTVIAGTVATAPPAAKSGSSP